MSELYYSSYEVERTIEYYKRELKERDSIIERLRAYEEEEECLSDAEKKDEGESARGILIKKYGSFEEALKRIDYSNEREFNDFYFAMFSYYEIKKGLIPEEAFKKARRTQIKNILFYTIDAFGDSIAKFGSRVRALKKDHMTGITERQYSLISILLTKRQKSFFLEHQNPAQFSYYKDSKDSFLI